MSMSVLHKGPSPLRTLSIAAATAGLLTLRSWDSMLRFPADPGYHYVLAAKTNGLGSWVQLDPYLHVAARALSWLASFAPIGSQSLVLAALVHLSWAACGVGIVQCLLDNGLRYRVAALGAAALAISPVAAESALGNVGNVKWPMLVLAVLVVSGNSIERRPAAWSVFLGLVGLTNPLSPILLVPLLVRATKTGRWSAAAFSLPVCVIALTALTNIVAVGPARILDGHGSSRVMAPWPGMGLFWWFGLLGPTAVAVVYATLRLVGRLRGATPFFDQLAVLIPVLSFVSYLFGGIADRYFVAPMVLSWILAVPVTISFHDIPVPSLGILAVALSIGLIGLTSLKWFSASSYLRAGPTWSSEVSRSRQACSIGLTEIELRVGDKSSILLPCALVARSPNP